MSEAMTNHEIEDVLSSIRRLVSEEHRPQAANPTVAEPKLLLTPALRVVPRVAAELPSDEAHAVFAAAAGAGAGAEADWQEDILVPGAVDAAPDWGPGVWDQSGILAGNEAAPEACAAQDVDVPEIAVPQIAAPEMALSDLAMPEMAAPDADLRKSDAPRSDAPVTGSPFSDAREFAPLSGDILDFVLANVPPAVLPPDDPQAQAEAPMWTDAPEQDAAGDPVWAPEAAEMAFVARPRVSAAVDAPPPPQPQNLLARAWADRAEAAVRAELSGEPVPGPGPRRPAPQESADKAAEEMTGDDLPFDEDALRDIVREMIREELAGTLGERITRNIRKLVRMEINRVAASREFE